MPETEAEALAVLQEEAAALAVAALLLTTGVELPQVEAEPEATKLLELTPEEEPDTVALLLQAPDSEAAAEEEKLPEEVPQLLGEELLLALEELHRDTVAKEE